MMYKCKCGSDGKTENETFYWIARCTKCDNQTTLYDSEKNAIKEWNKINRASHLAIVISSLLDKEIEKVALFYGMSSYEKKIALDTINRIRKAISCQEIYDL